MIDIHSAISTGNSEALAELERLATNKEDFSNCIHRSVGYGSFDLDIGFRRPKVTQHAALWLMPIVTRAGFNAPTVNNRQNQKWVHEWLGSDQSVTTFNVFPSYEAIAGLAPTGTYELIETMLRLRDSSESPFASGMRASTFQGTEFPSLTFMIGTVARNGSLPEMPDKSIRPVELLNRLETALHFENANAQNLTERGVIVSSPAQFSQAVFDGLLLWLTEIDTSMVVKAWSLDALGCGSIGLTLSVNNANGERCITSLPIKIWQIGSDGLERIKAYCSRWPLALSLWDSERLLLS